ncbi:MAG: hypothetical protein OXF20_03520 [Gammaproteobacteria bacterium]|nr:hypothetical protein [Gammaproteobacteria bacterium]
MKQQTWEASDGNGGSGGGGGRIDQGNPVSGIHGQGCKHGDGGNGGQGGKMPPKEGQIASIGGNGGKGFPGETLIFELGSLSIGDHFEITIGNGGKGGGRQPRL